jgi:hypothetical protein
MMIIKCNAKKRIDLTLTDCSSLYRFVDDAAAASFSSVAFGFEKADFLLVIPIPYLLTKISFNQSLIAIVCSCCGSNKIRYVFQRMRSLVIIKVGKYRLN